MMMINPTQQQYDTTKSSFTTPAGRQGRKIISLFIELKREIIQTLHNFLCAKVILTYNHGNNIVAKTQILLFQSLPPPPSCVFDISDSQQATYNIALGGRGFQNSFFKHKTVLATIYCHDCMKK